MDEEAGIRMTRSRRRLSVEQSEEIQSSPSTPSKKRSSKLPKPQLDNIVENAVVEQSKPATKRSIALEYRGADEDRVSSPRKRAIRVMSNTSLSESVQGLDSPRSKRALRRGSHAGSDTETVITPVRRSRRISKEFNKSPETPVDQNLLQKKYKKGSAANVQDVIAEESEKEDKNCIISTPSEKNQHPDETSQSPGNKVSEELNTLATVSEESCIPDKSSPASIRKSPRLSLKRSKAVPETSNENEPACDNIINDDDATEKLPTKNLSMFQANRSLPLVGAKNVSMNKKRSKSFTKSETDQKEDTHVYYSDNESRKVKTQKKINSEEKIYFESKEIGDHEKINTSQTTPCEIYENKENETDLSVCGNSINIHTLSHNKVRKSSTNISGINKRDISSVDEACILSTQNTDDVDSKENRKHSLSISKLNNNTCKDEEETKISSTIFMEDSDVNESDIEPPNPNKVLKNNESVVNVFECRKSNTINDTCEPMDIDETIPLSDLKIPSTNTTSKNLNKSILEWQQNSQLNSKNSAQNSTAKNESDYKDNNDTECNDKFNEEEKSHNSNKSTFILSVKNIELSNEENTSSKKSTILSKTSDIKSKLFDMNMNKEPKDKQNLSLAGAVNITPIRHKVLQNIGVVTSTPVLTQDNIESQEHSTQKKPKKGESKLIKQKSIDDVDIDNSSDEDANSLLDDEAKDVGDEYESGDSQDESEREYAEQNTIPVGGETLESEDDEESDNSDYEKDSFLVSSDEDDNELLSGSGDDLSISDNELKMTSKSKEKYNRRKIKEQKRASREMFNARHEKKLISDNDDSDPDIIFANKKRNRLRLDSSKDASDGKICEDEPEMSIIIANSSLNAKDPLLNISIKKEILDTNNASNRMLRDIENIIVDQDATMFTNKETENPLNSDNESRYSESSDDAGITDNYDSLLKGLNNSHGSKQYDNLSSDNIDAHVYENEAVEKSHATDIKKTKTNLSISELKGAKNKKDDNSLLDKLNITTSKKEKKKKNTGPAQSTNDDSNPLIFDSTDANVCLNTSSDKCLEEKDRPLRKKNKNKSVNSFLCQPSEEESGALLKLISKMEFDVTDSNQKPKKKNLSFTEDNTTKAINENSTKDKLNTTDSGKRKKSKTPEPKPCLSKSIDTEESARNTHDESSSESVNFKLLFAHDEDSNNTPENDEVKPEEQFIPLKKSQAKINLLENTTSFLKNDVGATNGECSSETNNNSKEVDKIKKKIKQLEEEVELRQFTDKIKKKKHKNSVKQMRMNTNEVTEDKDFQSIWETSKKTKTRGDDIPMRRTVVTSRENKVKVERLPASIIEKLHEKPRKSYEKSTAATATSIFEVQTIIGKRNKPSEYLEESIHIDATPARCSDHETLKLMKKPKVLPSLPSASTSTVGFTSNFKVNILQQEKRHDAKLAGADVDFVNFKSQRLYGSSIKRIATEELCRKQKKIKITKF